MPSINIAKRTKIVATVGPATESERNLAALARAGMDVMRLNFSHGDHAEHGARIERLRRVARRMGKPMAILQDLAGPKIRIGDFHTERVHLKKGSTFTLTTKKIVGDETKAYVNYRALPKEVKKGQIILLDDGKKKLRVERVYPEKIVCTVLTGGETKGRRGVNVPGANLSISSITAKDKRDLAFGLSRGVDFVALSFVRRPKDIDALRSLLSAARSDAGIIAKVETREAVENIDAIIERADGVMVARGDLAIEVPAQEVPLLQKMIIEKCNRAGKPVITATQMLESMISSPVPTRAEVSDVANSILDGTDAVMLSEETTLGKYPREAVEVMASIAAHTESIRRKKVAETEGEEWSVVDAVTRSVVHTAEKLSAAAIIALTETGSTARMVSRHKPLQPIVVMSPNERTRNKLALSYGCFPMDIHGFRYVGEVMKEVSKTLRRAKIAKKGDRAVIAAGVPFGKAGGTNMLLVHTV